MSMADPQTITISGVTTPLPRTETSGDDTVYLSGDGTVKLSINHSETKGQRKRHLVRLDLSKVAPDTFKPDENVERTMAIYLVCDMPKAGYTNAEALAAWVGFRTQLAASSDVLVSKLLAGES